ncbi:hypothetical protein DFQ01_12069 [Paenibacillus cellulosilyticus]|uniref:Uncharacterized protein n=1 Tax=Paenibacillus cellulosilyticus TaxID=375489 RepID=A0A2V2YQ99_9BACL|nr:hypothetical protein [Paenibacillus cellulosilyticus]PWV97882.1 hypothetical protein DFQ01_12069 [Paenibacillus cellulosilyticus]QKS46947.1 hypothetical protein HUB94_20970 [Paenibacillus cellulosilyticus]
MRYLILWFASVVMFNGAFIGLELLEGNKITTTEYYGLRNMGVAFLFITFFLSIVVSAIYLLVTAALHLLARRVWPLHYALYCGLGIYAGSYFFDVLYNESFVREFHLHKSSAYMLFGLAGALYSILDTAFGKAKALKQ